MLKFHT